MSPLWRWELDRSGRGQRGAADRRAFRARNGAVDCFDLTDTDFGSKTQVWKFLLSGKPLGCFRMAARYAPVAFAAIPRRAQA